MKKNLLSLAVAASVAGSAAAYAQDGAMSVNADKTGSVILFPYFNAENGNTSSFHVVNTTAESKAIKVRFLEFVNSYEILDFNLYLSPYDHFAFGVIKNPDGGGGALITSDNSCTVPALGSPNGAFPGSTTENADGSITRIQPFVDYLYEEYDANVDIERTHMGHIEIIEMGVVTDDAGIVTQTGAQLYFWESFLTHGADGVPLACSELEKSWADGKWAEDADSGITAPSGGLYGLSYLLNVEDAAAFGFEPTAIDGFWPDPAFDGDWNAHTDPGDTLPNLNNADVVAVVRDNISTTNYTTATFDSGVEAVSGILMSDRVMNDVIVDAAVGAQTDWVITFPTKRYHVDPLLAGAAAPVAPFTDPYVAYFYYDPIDAYIDLLACETVGIKQWNREEKSAVGGNGFSPKPEEAEDELCYETNVISHGTGSATNAEYGLVDLAFPYSAGWQRFIWNPKTPGSTVSTSSLTSSEGDQLGLPSVGFAAVKYTNDSVMNGAIANYGHAAEHKTQSTVSDNWD